jgi:hypothetical protein
LVEGHERSSLLRGSDQGPPISERYGGTIATPGPNALTRKRSPSLPVNLDLIVGVDLIVDLIAPLIVAALGNGTTPWTCFNRAYRTS